MTGPDWLRRLTAAGPTRRRLICFPYAGAGASVFNAWAGDAPPDLEILAAQLPGRETRMREAPVRCITDLAPPLAAAVAAEADQPYALFGHSMGALLAFEVTRALRAAGHRLPDLLAVSAFRAPDLPAWRPVASTLTDDALVARVTEMAGTSRTALVQPDLVIALARPLRADLEACEHYRYQHDDPLPVPAAVLAAHDDPEVRIDEMVDWHRHVGAAQVSVVGGGHLYLCDAPVSTRDHVLQVWESVGG